MKAVIDFACIDCSGTVEFNLMTVNEEKGQVSCPHCHRPYKFKRPFLDNLEKLRRLVLAVRDAEGILGDCNVAVTTPQGEVKIPYRLLLTRLNTLITLEVSGQVIDFNFRVEPLNETTFR